jgi:predicted porin
LNRSIPPRRLAVALPLGLVAVLAAPPAWSQVTVFGLLDLGLNLVRADGIGSQRRIDSDGNTSSRLGFRGSEDLGDGLRASFWVEAAIAPDTGLGGASSTNNKDSVNTGALTFGRRVTVGLSHHWGELRLGRDYVPSFGNLTTSMHPFGTNGVGSSGHLFYPVNAGGTTVRTSVRASNAIVYLLPDNKAGLYGSAMLAFGEQPSGSATEDDGRYHGLRLGWRNATWNMAVSTGTTRYASGDYRQSNAGINHQWGPARLMLLWGDNKVGSTRTRALMLGTQWQVGQHGELRLAVTTLKARNVASDARHLALGYVHDLSKRTALYANWARLENRGNGTRFNVGLAPTTPGGSSSGVDLGLRHTF